MTRGFQSPLRCADRGVVSSRTAADNRKIVFSQVSSAAGGIAARVDKSGVGFRALLPNSSGKIADVRLVAPFPD